VHTGASLDEKTYKLWSIPCTVDRQWYDLRAAFLLISLLLNALIIIIIPKACGHAIFISENYFVLEKKLFL
jgi:hypothetical protein